MFVAWRMTRLEPENDRSDPECVHQGHGRSLLTAHVMEKYVAPSGPRSRTVIRSPGLRSCCMHDPVVRVRWWNETADALLAQDGLDVDASAAELAKRVPMPTSDEELVNIFWPRETALANAAADRPRREGARGRRS